MAQKREGEIDEELAAARIDQRVSEKQEAENQCREGAHRDSEYALLRIDMI